MYWYLHPGAQQVFTILVINLLENFQITQKLRKDSHPFLQLAATAYLTYISRLNVDKIKKKR